MADDADGTTDADGFDHTPVTVRGKRAVVVGGTSGIGEAIALAFAADGADVVASSRNEARVAATADRLRARGAATVEATCDVTDGDSLAALRDVAIDRLGGVDVLVTSASAVNRDPLLSVPEPEWRRVIDVQLDGVYRAIQAIAPAIGEGSVVNVSSPAARLAMAELSAYSAAKGGVNALTRAAAKELAPAVRVNAIEPGFVLTPQNADVYAEGTEKRERVDRRAMLGRTADRGEIAGAAIYLASDAASYTTGEVITVDGGFSTSVF